MYRLKKALYSLKQAPRAWNARIDEHFLDNGFMKCPYEHALLKTDASANMLLVCLYVDDLIFTGNNEAMFDQFKKSMIMEFQMTDIGLIAHFLGIEVVQNEDGIFICQSSYAKQILEKFHIEACNPVNTPVDSGLELKKCSTDAIVGPAYF